MRRATLFLAAFALLCSGGAEAQTARQWRDSLAVLNRKIDALPFSSDLHLKKAAVNIELGQWDYAIDEYSLVLRNDPGNLAALFYRAYAYASIRRYGEAKGDYGAFLASVPRSFEARLGLAHVCMKLGEGQEAANELDLLVEHFPDSAAAYAARADFERRQGSYATALYDWGKAVELAPGNADYQISRVDLLLELGEKKAAAKALDEMVERGTPRGLLRQWYKKCGK